MNKNRPKHLNLLKIKFPVTAILSIFHRVTGVMMSLSLPLFLVLFGISLKDEPGFLYVRELYDQLWFKIVVAFYAWFLLHHFLSGIRFLLIDIDVGVMKSTARKSALLVNVLGISILLWLLLEAFL
jgi:succinate dehydrogenase / fumarate reductase cytochrome b subunit